MTIDAKIGHPGTLKEVGLEIVAWSPRASEYPEARTALQKLLDPATRDELATIAAEYNLPVLNFVVGERDKAQVNGDMVIRLCVPLSRLQENYHNRVVAISERVQKALHTPMDVLVIPERGLGIPASIKEAARLKLYQYGNPPKPLELVFDSRSHEVQRS